MPWQKGQSGNPNGRPAGLLGRRARELRNKAKASGCDPIDVMLDTIKDLVKVARRPGKSIAERHELLERACGIAKDAAPYLHPKLAAIHLSGDEQHPFSREADSVAFERLSAEQLAQLREMWQDLRRPMIDVTPHGGSQSTPGE